jgi:hypothetical protein
VQSRQTRLWKNVCFSELVELSKKPQLTVYVVLLKTNRDCGMVNFSLQQQRIIRCCPEQ